MKILKRRRIFYIYISLNFYSVFFVSFWENLVRFFSVRVFLTEKSGGEETCWLFYYAERNILTVFSIFFFYTVSYVNKKKKKRGTTVQEQTRQGKFFKKIHATYMTHS